MKKKFRTGLFVILVFTACQSNQSDRKNITRFDDATRTFQIPDTNDFGTPIFSNMYLNVQLVDFFKKGDKDFHSELLHEITAQSRYLTTAAKAVKLGVYAVDFNYTRMYEQFQESEHYLRTVVGYASSLGIPNDFSREAVRKIENSIADADTFEHIANEVYSETVQFLKMNENEYAIALILIGGWTEVMYIAANLMEMNDFVRGYVDIFLRQVTSLQEIIQIASQFQDYEEVKILSKQLVSLYEQMRLTHEAFRSNDVFQPMLQETLKEIMALRASLIESA